MEQETEEFYERVREGYLQLARNEPERILLIDGSRSPDEIEAGIWERLSQRFPSLLKNPK